MNISGIDELRDADAGLGIVIANKEATDMHNEYVWKLFFCKGWLADMACCRYNFVSSWSLHLFPNLVKLKNYLDVSIATVIYSNLKNGTYTLNVASTYIEGSWQQMPARIKLIVIPKFRTRFFNIAFYLFDNKNIIKNMTKLISHYTQCFRLESSGCYE